MHPSHGNLARNRLGIGALLLALLFLFSFHPSGAWAQEGSYTVRLTLLHTNDMHGRLHAQPLGKSRTLAGGITRIAGYAAKVRKEVEEKGGHVILVDAGDIYAGTPEGNQTQGRLCIEMMNAAGYAMGCIGNHEFDDGADNLAELAGLASFPLLAANILDKKSGKPPSWLKPYTLREFKGLKVAFLGVVTTDTDVISGGSGEMRFVNEEKALRKAANLAKKEGAVLCIGLTHVGLDRDKELSAKLPEIPLLIGGHSHTYLKKGWKNPKTGVWVVQAGCYATHVGRVDLVLSGSTGKILSLSATLVFLSRKNAPDHQEVKAILKKKSETIRSVMDKPLGEMAHKMDRGGRRFSGVSSPLGNLLTDLMREGGEADLAFHNRTGIREILPLGTVTLRDIFKVCPFGNTVYTLDLTGKEILELLEYALSKGNRYLLEISGGEVVYDPAREEGKCVISVSVGGKPVRPEATYRVATSNFIAGGGDAHYVFARGLNRKDTGKLLRDLLAERIRSSSPFRLDYKNRIIKG